MQVRYRVALSDFIALNLYLNKKSGVGRSRYLIAWLGLPLLCSAGAVRALQLDREGPAFFMVGVAVLWLIVTPYGYRDALARNVRTFVKKLGGRGIIGERALVFTEELLVAISETFRTEVRWENVQGVEVVGEHTYIFIAGISAVILPRCGFDSDEEYEAARDFALRKAGDRQRD
ncbi:YcxB family protein [Frigoriglobus tundricola]|uniref:YcxB-like C-terminal domain-containing protein n=1 Tax=Frigoriglobus tundricola TaxID=2774151 RepID=A0A6M5YFB8_9BACT|nr:YcxB family protein [Frigoriglobus tundricola]QJW92715.1 hypothetical protein FTUN_0212 [Frigoriglobus tundricola]